MKPLQEKINELEKKLEEKKTADAESDFTRVKIDVKEEAAKGQKVDIDVLHERLVLLESIARKQNNPMKDRFHYVDVCYFLYGETSLVESSCCNIIT